MKKSNYHILIVLINTVFRCEALIREEALIRGRRLFQCAYLNVYTECETIFFIIFSDNKIIQKQLLKKYL